MARARWIPFGLLLGLSACIHAPNLKIEQVLIEGIGPDLVSYSVRIRNVERHSLFSRCRTATADDKITIHGTISTSKQPGPIDAGSTVIIDPDGTGARAELPAGEKEDGAIEAEPSASPPQVGYLVVQLEGEGEATPCAVLGDTMAVALP